MFLVDSECTRTMYPCLMSAESFKRQYRQGLLSRVSMLMVSETPKKHVEVSVAQRSLFKNSNL